MGKNTVHTVHTAQTHRPAGFAADAIDTGTVQGNGNNVHKKSEASGLNDVAENTFQRNSSPEASLDDMDSMDDIGAVFSERKFPSENCSCGDEAGQDGVPLKFGRDPCRRRLFPPYLAGPRRSIQMPKKLLTLEDDKTGNRHAESAPETPHREYAVFFRFARDNCCNYSVSVPWGKKHYCWLEPKETDSLCVIQWGQYCRWFVEAVLPLDKALEAEWHRLRQLEADSNLLPWTKRVRACLCGKRFVPRSNRQLRCEDCGRACRQEQIRKRVRKHRDKRVRL